MPSIVVAPLLALAAALAPSSRDSTHHRVAPPVVTVIARDFAFSMPSPDTVPAGPVTFRLINEGKELHMLGVVWLGTHTLRFFFAALHGDSSTAGTYEVGGPNGVAPGDTAYATVILQPGHVALTCWVASADGRVHATRGMVAPLEVVPAAGHTAEEPHADVVLTLRNYAIAVSGTPAPGRHTFRVNNVGPAEHDVQLFRLEPGATMADIDAWFKHPERGSPRARPLSGMVGLEPGHRGWFTADLTPGDYMLLCWIPDEKGVPHYAGHGMISRFHVSAAQTPHTVDVYAADYAFVAPDSIRAGATMFHFVNRGPSQHHLTIFALPAGMSLGTFDRIMRAEGGGHGIRAIGGTENPAEGRHDAWAVLDLAPGEYVLTCMLPLPDGSGTHRSRGMFRPLTVLPATHPAAMPSADVVVRMTDYAFVSLDTLRAGRRWVRFTNDGHHAHLALVLRLAPGKTLADLAAWHANNEQGPNPTTAAGGVTEMAPGRSAMVQLDLEPGRYVLLCVDTDGTEPKMHAEMGMVRELTVTVAELGRME